MDIEGKLKKAFKLCGENLVIFLPRAIEAFLEVGTFFAFAILLVLILGLSLSSGGLSSLSDIDSMLFSLQAHAFFLVTFLIFGGFTLLFLTILLKKAQHIA